MALSLGKLRILAAALAASAAWWFLPPPAGADYEEGVAAFKKGDYETAYREMRPLAEQGFAAAQNDLGYLYYEGLAVQRDHREAARWYYRAAKQGLAAAQNNLAFLYEQGNGVKFDERRARAWYKQAAEQGHAGAQFNIGLMYQYGRGGKKQMVEAYKWFVIAEQRMPDRTSRDVAKQRRRMAANSMSEAEVAEGARRAKAWIAKFGKESLSPTTHAAQPAKAASSPTRRR